ncbi:hypothetical protein MAP00_003361 [Monascus purpureus]|nr:hypothetical protein MAP00_003361 [Monascus purpureus]
MFCLRSWLPLLFIPTNASPLFIISFVTLTYFLHRPCIYCSALLLILFLSSCNWSDRCFFDFRGDWLSPRFSPDSLATIPTNSSHVSLNHAFGNETLAGYVLETVNTTTKALAGAAVGEAQQKLALNGSALRQELTGFGVGWLRSLLGRQEWTLPCVDVKVRL